MDSQDSPYKTPESELLTSNALSADDLELASRMSRLGASILDSIIILIPMFAIYFLTGIWDRLISGDSTFSLQLAVFFCAIIVWLTFNGYLLKNHGQSIGKKIVGIQIVDVDSNKVPSLTTTAGIRYILIQSSSLIPIIGSIFIWIDILFIFRKDQRCVHDLVAKTKVVKYKATAS
ncbi:RDD family protein [bacterium SCSIO 12696]|nr:RDD family protein [bacterium SCSIO 12696]